MVCKLRAFCEAFAAAFILASISAMRASRFAV
jgi:hypothetical protein